MITKKGQCILLVTAFVAAIVLFARMWMSLECDNASSEARRFVRIVTEAFQSNMQAKHRLAVDTISGDTVNSWRFYLLPLIVDPAQSYNLREPWDGKANEGMRSVRPDFYVFPGDKRNFAANLSRVSRGPAIPSLVESNQVVLVETYSLKGHWMQAEDMVNFPDTDLSMAEYLKLPRSRCGRFWIVRGDWELTELDGAMSLHEFYKLVP